MASSNNKFSLLASLTSLPGDTENETPPSDDDDALPSLAVESVPEESSKSQSDPAGHDDSELFKSAAETSASQIKSKPNTASGGGLASSALLSSSGLLMDHTSSAAESGGGMFGGSSGGGLFDQIDEEEEAARQEEERRKYEDQERARIQEELRKEKEAAEAAKIQLLREEHERLQAEKAQAAATAEEEQRQLQFRQQQQQHQASYMNSESVMGTMQDLSLNDDPMGYRPQVHHQEDLGNTMNGSHVYSNVQNVPNQYSNVTNSQHQQTSSMMQPGQNQAGLANSMQHQNGLQYSNMNNGGTPNQHNQYNNVQPLQNGGGEFMQQSQQFQQPPVPTQSPQRQTTQEAGYGGASYFYSTTGNVQQEVYQHPNGTPVGTGTEGAGVGSVHATNGMMNQSTMSSYQVPQPQMQMQPNVQSPSNGMAPPAPVPSVDESNASYLLRSRMRQTASVHPMPNHNGNGAAAPNGVPGNHYLNRANPSNVQPYIPIYNPNNFQPKFGPITVTDPIPVQSPGIFAGPPHWTYAVVVRDTKKIEGQQEFSAVVSNVRRRFRHFVALEERLRVDCKGAILPPRPDKHNTRVIDEASARQSEQFAAQRANELSTYLNALRLHPVAGSSQCLHMFLTLPEHLGIAWPEVSSSIVTRLTKAGATTAVKVAEGTSAAIAELNSENQILSGEDNSELLTLSSSEGLRISSVLQSVPKIENAIVLLAEHSQRMNGSGMEIQKLVNSVLTHEKQYSAPFELLSSGLLRSGRRTSRLAVELGAAAQVFTLQHKLCRYERLAFSDRRSALIRRRDARKEADKYAQKLVMNQHSLQSMGMFGKLDGYGREAALSDEIAVEAVKEADEIGHILQCEVARVTKLRHEDWSTSLKIMAANMREAHAERAAIWESCKTAFMVDPSCENVEWTNGGDQQHNNMSSQHGIMEPSANQGWPNSVDPSLSMQASMQHGMQHNVQDHGESLQQQPQQQAVTNTN